MKKIRMLFFVALAFGMMLFNGCEEEDACAMSELNPSEDRTFVFDGYVKYQDGTPYVGQIKVGMFKTYCNGDENGLKQLMLFTNQDGYWNSNWAQTYTYTNIDDYVTHLVTVYEESGGDEIIGGNSRHWYWPDVDTEFPNGYIYFTGIVTLDD